MKWTIFIKLGVKGMPLEVCRSSNLQQ